MYHPENENVRTFDAVDNDVLANGEAARAGAEVFITGASGVREGGEEKEPTCYRVNQPGGDVHAGAFPGDVEPDVIKISFGLWRYTVRHSSGQFSNQAGASALSHFGGKFAHGFLRDHTAFITGK